MGNANVKKLRARDLAPPARTVRATLLFLALLMMEAAPVSAWLIVYAATQLGDPRLSAAPFWLLIGVLSLFAAARWRLARYGAAALVGAWVVLTLVSVLTMARFSPLMFGGERLPLLSTSWLGALFYGETDYSALAGLIPLAAFLAWRGNSLGNPAPMFSHVTRRFAIGLGALTLAIFGGLAAPPSFQGEVTATLLALLTLEGFGGLAALALSRPLSSSERADVVMPGAEYSARWQVTAMAIALVIVAIVAGIGIVLDLSAAQLLFTWLAPVGSLLNGIGDWLTQTIAYLLYLISVFWLRFLIPKNLPQQPVHTPQPPKTNKNPHFTPVIPATYASVVTIILGALVVIGILVLLFVLARVLVNSLNKPTAEDVEEERERLDASSLLRQQARDWLNRWFGARRGAAERDELRRGSARWLYRELLRAGARAGYERRTSETADEYAERLAVSLDTGNSHDADLRALTRAYDNARYGGMDDDPPASDETAAQTRRVTQHISALGKEPAQRLH